MQNQNKKSTSLISWGQLLLLFGVGCFFLFALTQSAKIKPEVVEPILGYEISNNGTIIKYRNNESEVVIPTSFSLGKGEIEEGTITFYSTNEALNFLDSHYTTAYSGYYAFYNRLYQESYPWEYSYSIEKATYMTGSDYKITSIGREAFKGNSTIEKLVLPEYLESIELFAFQNCTNLKKVEWNKNLISIGDSSFWGTAIEEITTLPDKLEIIYPYAFFDCKKLKEAIIPKNVKKMNLGTFNGCTSLVKAKIESVNDISSMYNEVYHPFSRCTALQEILIPYDKQDYYTTTLPWSLYNDYYKTYIR